MVVAPIRFGLIVNILMCQTHTQKEHDVALVVRFQMKDINSKLEFYGFENPL